MKSRVAFLVSIALILLGRLTLIELSNLVRLQELELALSVDSIARNRHWWVGVHLRHTILRRGSIRLRMPWLNHSDLMLLGVLCNGYTHQAFSCVSRHIYFISLWINMVVCFHLLVLAHECNWCQPRVLEKLVFVTLTSCKIKVRDFLVLRMILCKNVRELVLFICILVIVLKWRASKNILSSHGGRTSHGTATSSLSLARFWPDLVEVLLQRESLAQHAFLVRLLVHLINVYFRPPFMWRLHLLLKLSLKVYLLRVCLMSVSPLVKRVVFAVFVHLTSFNTLVSLSLDLPFCESLISRSKLQMLCIITVVCKSTCVVWLVGTLSTVEEQSLLVE